MSEIATQSKLKAILSDYGMIVVLAILMVVFSVLTIERSPLIGSAAGSEMVDQIKQSATPQKILIFTANNSHSIKQAEFIMEGLAGTDHEILTVDSRVGTPPDLRDLLDKLAAEGQAVDVLACDDAIGSAEFLKNLSTIYADHPPIGSCEVLRPSMSLQSKFLDADNLINVAQTISIIAIIAIGMTMVIITAGIDLSVGSLIALSGIVTTMLIVNHAGAEQASVVGVLLCCFAGLLACSFAGFLCGYSVAAFGVPPFIVTLCMMLAARGLAYDLSNYETIYQLPDFYTVLGKGRFLGIPWSVILMVVLYAVAHFVMSRTTLGRQIYAIGGNEEAARLSGVSVKKNLLIVYTVCGFLAGLGGLIMSSKLDAAHGKYGVAEELRVIAAVVVGGTSLMGGQGKIIGTLIGALIIGVIQNGMNLIELSAAKQDIVLGAVILGAVLIDRYKKGQVDLKSALSVFKR
jgi:ribose transport system permease protein